MGVDEGFQQAVLEGLGLFAGVEEAAVLAHAFDAEVVADAAYGDDQGVVAEAARGDDLLAGAVEGGRQLDLATFAVQAHHAAQAVTEVVARALGQVFDLVFVGIEGAGGHFVQQRFPDVGAGGVHQGDVGLAALAELVAQPGGQFQAAGAPADDEDAMGTGGGHGDSSCARHSRAAVL